MSAAKAVIEKATPILEEAFDHFLIIGIDEDKTPHQPILLAHGDTSLCLRLTNIARRDLQEVIESQKKKK